jgi:hypothetical protein
MGIEGLGPNDELMKLPAKRGPPKSFELVFDGCRLAESRAKLLPFDGAIRQVLG